MNNYDCMSLILQGENNIGAVYLGGLDAANNSQMLRNHKIGAVLSILDDNKISLDKTVKHLFIRAEDNEQQQIEQFFTQTFNFIEQQRKSTNLLIHCRAGISRSSTILLAYMMEKYDMDLDSAHRYLLSKRWFVKPNPSFLKQLKKFDTLQNIKRRLGTPSKQDQPLVENKQIQQTPQLNTKNFLNHRQASFSSRQLLPQQRQSPQRTRQAISPQQGFRQQLQHNHQTVRPQINSHYQNYAPNFYTNQIYRGGNPVFGGQIYYR